MSGNTAVQRVTLLLLLMLVERQNRLLWLLNRN